MSSCTSLRCVLLLIACICLPLSAAGNQPPVADAGPDRYIGDQPLTLDGGGSFDPDTTGTLTYTWTQTTGPTVTLLDADTPTPTIQAVQTDTIQSVDIQLIANDGLDDSDPDVVTITIVPAFEDQTVLGLESGPFDPDKPTFI